MVTGSSILVAIEESEIGNFVKGHTAGYYNRNGGERARASKRVERDRAGERERKK